MTNKCTAVSCVVCKKTFVNRWNMDRHKKNDHGLTERGNVVENSLGIALFTTEALVKETVIKTRSHLQLWTVILRTLSAISS